MPTLTNKQINLLRLLIAGKLNKEIAYALGTTECAIKSSVRLLVRKFGASNRVQLAVAGYIWLQEHQADCVKPIRTHVVAAV